MGQVEGPRKAISYPIQASLSGRSRLWPNRTKVTAGEAIVPASGCLRGLTRCQVGGRGHRVPAGRPTPAGSIMGCRYAEWPSPNRSSERSILPERTFWPLCLFDWRQKKIGRREPKGKITSHGGSAARKNRRRHRYWLAAGPPFGTRLGDPAVGMEGYIHSDRSLASCGFPS